MAAVTDAVHERGGRIFLQLMHARRISHPSLQPGGGRPVAPSTTAGATARKARGTQPRDTELAVEPRVVSQSGLGP